jgi:hypothetical protein
MLASSKWRVAHASYSEMTCRTCKLLQNDVSTMQATKKWHVQHARERTATCQTCRHTLQLNWRPHSFLAHGRQSIWWHLVLHACRPRNQVIRPRCIIHVPMEAPIWMVTPCTKCTWAPIQLETTCKHNFSCSKPFAYKYIHTINTSSTPSLSLLILQFHLQ